ncbi:MAG: ribonuclease HII [Gammaproteobacteria bacterium]|nr:ribonuclease HII [Gammaproteobacteria bacterium]
MDMAYYAGVDEAGRGPLAGPVVAAAVILDPNHPIAGLNDSKKLTARQRERLAPQIQAHALAWAITEASVEEIDELNILQASLLAMRRAVERLTVTPDTVRVDGPHCPRLNMPVSGIIKGDQKDAAITAASILAKVERDRIMVQYHQQYPEYGFAAHKGYPTAQHRAALERHGISDIHRKSYAPVARFLTD